VYVSHLHTEQNHNIKGI